MAKQIGIRELKYKTSTILRQVREEAAEYIITHHGQPIAILRPIRAEDQRQLEQEKSKKLLENLLALGNELFESSPQAQSATELLEKLREEENQ